VHITPAIRTVRLSNEYELRGQSTDQYVTVLAMRELDETPVVKQSRSLADFVVEQSTNVEQL
jgi:hypothetical protein